MSVLLLTLLVYWTCVYFMSTALLKPGIFGIYILRNRLPTKDGLMLLEKIDEPTQTFIIRNHLRILDKTSTEKIETALQGMSYFRAYFHILFSSVAVAIGLYLLASAIVEVESTLSTIIHGLLFILAVGTVVHAILFWSRLDALYRGLV